LLRYNFFKRKMHQEFINYNQLILLLKFQSNHSLFIISVSFQSDLKLNTYFLENLQLLIKYNQKHHCDQNSKYLLNSNRYSMIYSKPSTGM
jgi:hypothetical protein